MLSKKVCLLGWPAVGKSSLVRRFVSDTYSDKYLSTIGVRIERKQVRSNGRDVNLLIWDIHGEGDSLVVSPEFLRGTAAYLFVVDGTRPDTVEALAEFEERVTEIAPAPAVVAINKTDLGPDTTAIQDYLLNVPSLFNDMVHTSAKDGSGVQEAFSNVAELLVGTDAAST